MNSEEPRLRNYPLRHVRGNEFLDDRDCKGICSRCDIDRSFLAAPRVYSAVSRRFLLNRKVRRHKRIPGPVEHSCGSTMVLHEGYPLPVIPGCEINMRQGPISKQFEHRSLYFVRFPLQTCFRTADLRNKPMIYIANAAKHCVALVVPLDAVVELRKRADLKLFHQLHPRLRPTPNRAAGEARLCLY